MSEANFDYFWHILEIVIKVITEFGRCIYTGSMLIYTCVGFGGDLTQVGQKKKPKEKSWPQNDVTIFCTSPGRKVFP